MSKKNMMSSVPAYKVVTEDLRKRIKDGTYPVGSLIPNESALEEIYHVSRTTIRRAIGILAQENLLRVKQGYGTEVLSVVPNKRFTDVIGFEEVLPFDSESTEILQMTIDVVQIHPEDVKDLGLKQGDLVYRIQRIRGYQQAAYQISVNYLSTDLVPGIEQYCGKFQSLYPLLQEKYSLVYTSSVEEVTLRKADFMESQILQIPYESLVVQQRRVAQCTAGPMEVSYIAVRPDIYKLRVTMDVNQGQTASP